MLYTQSRAGKSKAQSLTNLRSLVSTDNQHPYWLLYKIWQITHLKKVFGIGSSGRITQVLWRCSKVLLLLGQRVFA
ncbi:MAG TPA: hypothetical protein V6D11_00915 [Waterburya sp.]|jgi:hypothetical protein